MALVALAETRESRDDARAALGRAALEAILQTIGEPADEIVLAPAHTVLKTSSGKLRRAASRDLYESGAIGARAPHLALQIARLVAHAVLPQARRFVARTAESSYAIYASAVLIGLAAATWLVTAVLPRSAWAVGRRAARLFFRLIGVPHSVRGLQHLPHGTPSVLVAN